MWRLRTVRPLARTSARMYKTLHDPLEHATGIEKRELLAHLAGDCDPYHMKSIKKGPGTAKCPNLIPSAFDKRIVACICHPAAGHAEYMVLHQGTPKRCGCGHWFELCAVSPL